MSAVAKERSRKIILWCLVACGVLLVALIGIGMWTGSTEPIESVARTFKPREDWKQTRYTVEPPRVVCLDGRCPDLTQSWEVSSITESDVRKFIGDQREVSLNEFRCTYNKEAYVDSCVVSGVRDDYNFQVYVDKSREGKDTFKIDLFIRKGV